MLYLETVKSTAFSVLKELMGIEELNHIQLVGGTALAMQLGHRVSDDLDLFSNIPFSNDNIISILYKYFGERYQLKSRLENKLGVFGFIDNIKIDICRHKEQLIGELFIEEGIRM